MFDLLIKSVKAGGKNIKDVMIHRFRLILAGSDGLDATLKGLETPMKSIW